MIRTFDVAGSLPAVTADAMRRRALGALAVVSLALLAPVPLATAGPSRADVVRLPFPRYDGSLTPYTFELGYPLVTLVYDTLMWRDAAGTPRPWLARSVTRSHGGRRVTVRLRRGVRWHDGRALTAADVAFTFRFIAARLHPRFTPQLADIVRVRASGRLTATFDLRRPSLGFDAQPLADVPILPAHLWRGLAADRPAPRGRAVGSGPYRLVRAGPSGGYVFRANRGYFRGAPLVREIRVPIIDGAEATYDALRRRRVDMVPLSLPRRIAEEFESTAGIVLRRGPSYAGTALLLNLRRAPFQSASTRRAIAAALDLRRIVRNVGPAATAVEGQLHPLSRWAPGVFLQRFDAAAAQRALARVPRAPIRVMAPQNDPVRLEAGRQVVLALRRAGAGAVLVRRSTTQLSRATGETGSPPDFDAAIRSTPALVSEDPDFLAALYGSRSTRASLNPSGYRSERFDALARQVASAPDRRRRLAAIGAELRLLARDLPSVPLFFSDGVFAVRSAVYDRWTFVKGTGILDKRSFLPGATAARGPAAALPGPVEGATGGDSGSGLGVVDVVSILVLAAVVLLAGVALVQRRS